MHIMQLLQETAMSTYVLPVGMCLNWPDRPETTHINRLWQTDWRILDFRHADSKSDRFKFQIKKYQEYTGYLMVFVLFFLSLPATPFFFGTYPLINVYITIENHHRTSEFSHETWGFSIAIWLFTRGYVSKGWQLWPTAGVLHPDLNLGDQKINHTLW